MGVLIDIDQVFRRDVLRVFIEGHVSDIQEPADFAVVGKLIEVLHKMLDRQPRTFGILMHGGFGDRQDARSFATAIDAVLVFTPAHGSDTLGVDDGVKEVFGDLGVFLDMLPSLTKIFISLDWVPLVIQKSGSRVPC